MKKICFAEDAEGNLKMDDLISRREAINAVKKNTFRLTFAEEQNCEGHVAWSANAVYSDVMEGALLELPSAQPGIKTGRWIKPTGMMPPEHHGHYECSECGAWAMRPWLRPWKGVVLSDFCPACGAPMRKDGEG